MKKILFFSGSLRRGSLNCHLAHYAHTIAREHQGIKTEFISLKDFEMPLYDGDYEAEHGLPANAKKLKKLFIEADGLYIASPEYNSSITAALKNAIDWISRPESRDEEPLIAFKDKVAAISAASSGYFGGVRGLVPLRAMLSNINVLVIPEQVVVPNADKVIINDSKMEDERVKKMIKHQVERLCHLVKVYKS